MPEIPAEREMVAPTGDHELLERLDPIAVALFESLDTEGMDLDEAIGVLRQRVDPIIDEVGRERVLSAVLLDRVLVDRPSDAYSKHLTRLMTYAATLMLQPTPQEVVRTLGPYWPPKFAVVDRYRLGKELERTFQGAEAPPVPITHVTIVEELRAAWAMGDHRLDGLIDYLFDRGDTSVAIVIPWQALRAATLREPAQTAEQARFHSEMSLPYDGYYRMRATNLPEGRLEQSIAFFLEMAKSEVLWDRVFAAQMVREVAYMRDPQIVDALRVDPHWLIQRRLNFKDSTGEWITPLPEELGGAGGHTLK